MMLAVHLDNLDQQAERKRRILGALESSVGWIGKSLQNNIPKHYEKRAQAETIACRHGLCWFIFSTALMNR
jgi:hypothetical protein